MSRRRTKNKNSLIKERMKNYCKTNRTCRRFRRINRTRKVFTALYKASKVFISILNIGLVLYVMYDNIFNKEEE